MRSVYIDTNLFIPFLIKSEIPHIDAVNYLIKLLENKSNNIYLTSIFSLVETYNNLLNKIPNQKNLREKHEAQIIKALTIIAKKLDLKTVGIRADNLFPQISYLCRLYNVPFNVAFHTLTMKENKTRTLATIDEHYDLLFSQGVLIKFR